MCGCAKDYQECVPAAAAPRLPLDSACGAVVCSAVWLGTLPLVLIGEYGWMAAPGLSIIAFLFLTVEVRA